MKINWITLSECFTSVDTGVKHSISLSIDYLVDILTFKNGSLGMISIIFGWTSILTISSDKFTSFLMSVWSILGENVELRDILVALTVEICIIFFFWIFSMGDFGSGLVASVQENKRKAFPEPLRLVIKSSKLWKSFWKFFGVVTLTTMMSCMAILCAILGSELLYWTCIWFVCAFGLMASGYEFYSIGENLARMDNGKKYPIFHFFEKVLDKFSEKIINKIDKNE